MKNWFFFLDKQKQKFLMFYILTTQGYSIASLVRFEHLLGPKEITTFKIRFSRNSQISVWKANVFLGKL